MTTEHLDALTLNGWADGLLGPEAHERAAAHLAQCAECAALAAGQAQVAALLQRLPPEAPPARLARTVAAAVSGRRRSETAWRRLSTATAAAALLGLVLVALAWPDVARLLQAAAILGSLSATSLTALADLPAETVGLLANSTFDWGTALTSGAGAAMFTGLVLLAGAALGGLAQLLRPVPLSQF